MLWTVTLPTPCSDKRVPQQIQPMQSLDNVFLCPEWSGFHSGVPRKLFCFASDLGEHGSPELPYGLISPVFQTWGARAVHNCCLNSPRVGENTNQWVMAYHIKNVIITKSHHSTGKLCGQEDGASVIGMFGKTTLFAKVHYRSWMGGGIRIR